MKVQNHSKYGWVVVLLLIAGNIKGQTSASWDSEKIRGEHFYIENFYEGQQFLVDEWTRGKVLFEEGNALDGLRLKFNVYTDDLIYYNELHSIMVRIDPEMVRGFEFENDGALRKFEKIYYDGFGVKGNRYFEVLYEGKNRLVSWRQVKLLVVTPYYDSNGNLKNMHFEPSHRYFLVDENGQFQNIGLSKNAVLRSLSKADRKLAKRVARRQKLDFKTEAGMVNTIRVLEENNINLVRQ